MRYRSIPNDTYEEGEIIVDNGAGDVISIFKGPLDEEIFLLWKSTILNEKIGPPRECLESDTVWKGLLNAYGKHDPEKEEFVFDSLFQFRKKCDLKMYNSGIQMDSILLFQKGGVFYLSTKSGEFSPIDIEGKDMDRS
jgi:hypothetical protein